MTSSTQPPTTICVFCGSSPGNTPIYLSAARSLAQEFHKQSIHLVYGGGTNGLMGEIAKTLVALSGPESVHGIIPKALVKYEQASDSRTEHGQNELVLPDENVYGRMTVVSTMHERKQLMTEMVLAGGPGSGFIALPGGYGTLEELAEVTTWNQLGIQDLGVVLFDVDGFYKNLLEWIKTSIEKGFISERNGAIIRSSGDAEGCVRELREYRVSEARFKLDWKEK